jgi:type IV pilus assembly protein PilO
MLLVVAAMWWAGRIYFIVPRTDDINRDQERLEALEGRNRRARIEANQRDALEDRMAVMERQLRVFEEFIPDSEEVPELLDAISHEAALVGVEMVRLRPQAAEAGEYYTKQTWELAVLGEYHDIGRFLARVASLPRIIKPANVQISLAPLSRATRNMEAPLEVSLVIETFVIGSTPTTPVSQGASRG